MSYGVIIYVNIIITTVNALLVWDVSTSIGYFQDILKHTEVVSTTVGNFEVILEYIEVFGCLFYLHDNVGGVVCVLDYVTGSVDVFPGLCFVLVLCDCI